MSGRQFYTLLFLAQSTPTLGTVIGQAAAAAQRSFRYRSALSIHPVHRLPRSLNLSICRCTRSLPRSLLQFYLLDNYSKRDAMQYNAMVCTARDTGHRADLGTVQYSSNA